MSEKVIDRVEKDRPPAGTPCLRCKNELKHFCAATEYIDDTMDAFCEACLEAEDCPVVAKRKEKEPTVAPDLELSPARQIVSESNGHTTSPLPDFEAIAQRIGTLEIGEVARFRPPIGMALSSFQTQISQRLVSGNFTLMRDVDKLVVKRIKPPSNKVIIQKMEPPMPSPIPVAPLSSKIAEKGIRTARDFVDFMSALMADVVSNRIHPQQAQAACNAAEKMLRAVELQRKYVPTSETALELIPSQDQKMLEGGK